MIKSLAFVVFLCMMCQGKVFRFDYEFIEPADGWMKLHIVPSTWREARLRCHAEGAVLASPLTNQLKKAIISFVLRQKGNTPTTIFTGIHASFSKGDYTTIEGVPMSRLPISWAPGEPDNFENAESCLAMITDSKGSTSDVRCGDVLPYVCYKKFTQLTMTACGTTDPAYILEPRTGSCYKVHRRSVAWNLAFMTCLAEGAYLVVINSDIEAEALKEIFEKHPDNTIRGEGVGSFSAGFHDWGDHQTWMTIHGETLDAAGYESWADGQPDNSTRARTGDLGEFCGVVFRDVKMNDWWCNLPVPFICEKSRDSLF